MEYLEERCLVDEGETILNKKAVYEPSKGQRFRQVVCTRSWAVVILIAMGVAMVAVAVIAAFARPAGPMKLACGSTSDNANSSSAALSADPSAPGSIDQSSRKASPFIATNGEKFPWEDLRLPPSIRPLEYNILVHPNISESYFTGRVTMTLSVVENTDFIVFHASGLNISKVRAFEGKMDEARRDKEGFSDIMFDTELDLKRHLEYLVHEQHYVQMVSVLSAATFLQLVVDFRGSLAGLTSMRGLYKSLYTVGKEKRYMVSTHFEATFAREAFPCLDEPQLKAKFTMSLVRDKNHISLFNTPLLSTSPYEHDLVLDQYEPTREMSTYLVAYVVCDFKNISKVTRDGVTVRVFAPEDKIYMGQYALDTAVTVLEYYTSFFGIPYPLPKQDLIAIPNFAAGAMENWGLITYRDTAVLYDPNMSSESSKKWVATVVAHELAHQWFGNLVTMKWWNDLWLNEGFASFVEYIGVESVDKDFHMMDSFISALGDALYLDSFPSSHPIQVKVEDPAEIMAVFDKISYDKGASLIRMLRGFMGETDFKAGLTSYLKKYSYSNAETKDLWDSFQEAGKLPPDLTVAKVMDTWTLQMGYPVVSITRQQGKLLLSQERFLLSEGSPTDDSKFVSPFGYTWHVPFTYMTSEDPSNRHLVWMKRSSAAIELPSSPLAWLKANVDTRGYYRVNYDQEGWQAIIQQLNTDHKVFSVLDRAGLLDDAFSLARSGQLSYAVALDMTLYLSKETSIFVWAAASSHISFLKGRLYLDEDYDVLKAHMFSLAKTQYEKLGWTNEGTHLEKKMRAFMISLAISSEYQPAVDKAVDIFGQWKANQSVSMNNNLRGSIYATGLLYGKRADWEMVFERYQHSTIPSEKGLLLHALGAPRDARILQMLLEFSLDTAKVKSQDTSTVVETVAANPNGLLLAWRFFRQRWDTIFARYGEDASMLSNLLRSVTTPFNSQFDYDEIADFFQDKDVGSAKMALKQALEVVLTHVDWAKSNLATVKSWLKTNVHSHVNSRR